MLLESSKIGIGGYFSVEFPDIPEHERYDFAREDLKKADFCDKYPYLNSGSNDTAPCS